LDTYYAILGLDPGASQESIKVAYRRLAREVHPDSKIHATESEKSVFSTHMAQLNEAYSILSDAKRRREYDEQLRIQGILIPRIDIPKAEKKTDSKPSGSKRSSYRPRSDADSAVVGAYSNHLRTRFLTKKGTFSWKVRELEGFDWALEALFWSSHYCVALRGFSEVNSTTIKKFINYAEVVIAQRNRHIRKSYFLFLLPFQKLSDWEMVSAQCQRFASVEHNANLPNPPAGILLLDMQHSRTLRFGTPSDDKKFEEIHKFIGIPT
jgi:curved DNA-binding protein CbpA